ncbi:MAG TPA: MerR family transcriptional regulator [Mariprofundaceae bacterium]|nr:MerR family transcriptional regulator [Mariprofundaceae bacterium]
MNAQAQGLINAGVQIPEIPDKLFFSIREVSELCDVEAHVLRYWETEFRHIKPVKKSGNRRFYRQKDIYTILHIKHLLYDLNFTIKGARKRLMNGDINDLAEQNNTQDTLKMLKQELVTVLELLDD